MSRNWYNKQWLWERPPFLLTWPVRMSDASRRALSQLDDTLKESEEREKKFIDWLNEWFVKRECPISKEEFLWYIKSKPEIFRNPDFFKKSIIKSGYFWLQLSIEQSFNHIEWEYHRLWLQKFKKIKFNRWLEEIYSQWYIRFKRWFQ